METPVDDGFMCIEINGKKAEVPVREMASRLAPGTLESIRRGIPVSMMQAMAAIAYQSLQPKKRPWWKRFLWWMK